MSSKPKGRPNTPSEDANIAPAAGIKVLNAALAYLADPDGLDAVRDFDEYIRALESVLVELEWMEVSYSTNDKVKPEHVEVFRRADEAAELVMTHTRADDVQVRINHVLEDFRQLWKNAATGV